MRGPADPQATQRSGSRNTRRNRLPPLVRGSYRRVAPLVCASSRARNSPRPVPRSLPVKNGSKIRSRCCTAMPGPAVGHFEKRAAPWRPGVRRAARWCRCPARSSRISPRSRTGSRRSGAAATGRPALRRRRAATRWRGARAESAWWRRTRRGTREPGRQARRVRAANSRGAPSTCTFSMIWRTRSPLVRMISVRRLSSSESDGRFAQQLRRVAHGADGIADLVRDAGRQAAEPRELGLLDLRGEQLGVFEEHDDRRGIRAAERGEMRLDHVAAIGRHEGLRGRGRRRGALRARSRVDRAAAARPRPAARPDRRCDRRAAARRIR